MLNLFDNRGKTTSKIPIHIYIRTLHPWKFEIRLLMIPITLFKFGKLFNILNGPDKEIGLREFRLSNNYLYLVYKKI